MPVFHDLQTIFVHIPKNAGRSIEKALLGDHGTPDGGRRSLGNRTATLLQRRTASSFAQTHLIGTLDYTFASQHLTYIEMSHLRLISDDVLNTYETFAVARNPYDRAVSTVLHFEAADNSSLPGSAPEFEYALKRWLDRPKEDHNLIAHDRTQSDYIVDDRGRQAVKNVLRFEQLADDFANFIQSIGKTAPSLSWSGKAQRSRNYQDYYTPDARKAVEEKFGEDLDRFEYSYGSS